MPGDRGFDNSPDQVSKPGLYRREAGRGRVAPGGLCSFQTGALPAQGRQGQNRSRTQFVRCQHPQALSAADDFLAALEHPLDSGAGELGGGADGELAFDVFAVRVDGVGAEE